MGPARPARFRESPPPPDLAGSADQRDQFKRLGVLGEWDNPYLTLHPEYEAEELRLFAELVDKGFVYRGKKPVYWSIPCRTALAEAEVEYQDHVSQSVYVKFPIVGETDMHLLIWTTTPWACLLYTSDAADDLTRHTSGRPRCTPQETVRLRDVMASVA